MTNVDVVITLTHRNHEAQMKEWCTAQLGPEQTFHGEKDRWCIGAGWDGYLLFRFPTDIDAMAFKLRWK